MNTPAPARISRRTAIQWMFRAAAVVAVSNRISFGAVPMNRVKVATGYGRDPDLTRGYAPGDFWPLTFTGAERRTVTALCDVIIPADEKSPSASAVGVPDFIDEWISAPYPGHDTDRILVVEGLAWVDAESRRRYQNDFADLTPRQQTALCDEMCHPARRNWESMKKGAEFFARFRDLTGDGFYTTPEGMKDLGYMGNQPLASYDGPPPEVLKQLGLV
jgi:hypothetical protein